MEIRIHIPRPLLTLSLLAAVALWWGGVITLHLPGGSDGNDPAVGGTVETAALITDAVRDIDRERVTQAVLERQEDILRYQLSLLEEEALASDTPEVKKKLEDTRAVLLSVIGKRQNSEKLLRLSLQQLWEAEGSTFTLKRLEIGKELDWPVEPRKGISAFFEDDGYHARFGVDHHAIDIPTPQGTAIRAPADGTVAKVALNGLGYSFVVLDHGGGLQTVYGHIIDATVKAGDRVTFAQVIGHTGGTPGTPGAGLLTTGPHLHFAVRKDGILTDPLQYLPKLERVSSE